MPLKVLDLDSLRPTSVMLRRKFFDSFQDWEGINFCDFFAGSGAMAVEALSRGSNKIFLNDKNRKVHDQLVQIKDQVLQKSEIKSEQIKISSIDGTRCFKNLLEEINHDSGQQETWCFFVDPPYDHQKAYEQFFDVFQKIAGQGEFFAVIEGENGRGMSLDAWQEAYPNGKCLWHGDHYMFMTWL
jgi:16S rRNA (guanine966-N2)-methyltransferase